MSSIRRRNATPPWGLLFSSLALGAIGQFLLWTWEKPQTTVFQLGIGWILMALGGLLLLKAWRRLQDMGDLGFRDKAWPVWAEVSALLVLLVFALFMRTVKLDTYPNAGFRDEG